MTLVMKEVPPGHRSRCREDQVVLAVENKGDRVLSYRPVSEAVIDFDLVSHVIVILTYNSAPQGLTL